MGEDRCGLAKAAELNLCLLRPALSDRGQSERAVVELLVYCGMCSAIS